MPKLTHLEAQPFGDGLYRFALDGTAITYLETGRWHQQLIQTLDGGHRVLPQRSPCFHLPPKHARASVPDGA